MGLNSIHLSGSLTHNMVLASSIGVMQVLCPSNDAQEIGCAVYLIGNDIEALSIQSGRSQGDQLSSIKGAPSWSHTHRLDCPGGAEDGTLHITRIYRVNKKALV